MNDMIDKIEESNLNVKMQNEIKEIIAAFIITLDGVSEYDLNENTGLDIAMCKKIVKLHRRTMDNFKEALHL